MRECPSCGRLNLNACQGCGRGFDGPDIWPPRSRKRRILPSDPSGQAPGGR